jgi:hypothetical protein
VQITTSSPTSLFESTTGVAAVLVAGAQAATATIRGCPRRIRWRGIRKAAHLRRRDPGSAGLWSTAADARAAGGSAAGRRRGCVGARGLGFAQGAASFKWGRGAGCPIAHAQGGGRRRRVRHGHRRPIGSCGP